MEYLEEAYPQKPLLPKDVIERGQVSSVTTAFSQLFTEIQILSSDTPLGTTFLQVRQICQVIACGIQPLQNPLVAQKARPDDPEQQKEWQAFYIDKGFKGDLLAVHILQFQYLNS